MQQERIPKAGDFYRHFKGKLYQIVSIAIHSETREQLVIYQALYDDFKVYARPLTMFLSEVDRDKYPNVTARYRFELVAPEDLLRQEKPFSLTDLLREDKQNIDTMKEEKEAIQKPEMVREENKSIQENETINEDLMAFLDASGYAEKLEILYSIRKRIDDRMMTDIEMSLDLFGHEGSLDERINLVKNNLQTLAKFECSRLR